jgi:hypothetical protein
VAEVYIAVDSNALHRHAVAIDRLADSVRSAGGPAAAGPAALAVQESIPPFPAVGCGPGLLDGAVAFERNWQGGVSALADALEAIATAMRAAAIGYDRSDLLPVAV